MKSHLWLIQSIGVIVPRRLRADWRQEWEAELRNREMLLADWDKLNWRSRSKRTRKQQQLDGRNRRVGSGFRVEAHGVQALAW